MLRRPFAGRSTWPLALALIGLLATTPTLAHDPVEAACTALVMDYAYYRDRHNAEPYAALFAEDAVLSVLGVDYRGRAAIKARLENDDGSNLSRHHMSTVKIMPVDDNTARGISYVTVYSEPRSADLPLKTAGFITSGEYHDTFTRTSEGWKIQRREYRPVFESP